MDRQDVASIIERILSEARRDDALRPLLERMDQAARVLDQAGVSVEDLLRDLPQMRDEVARELYGAACLDDLARQRAALRPAQEADGQEHEPADDDEVKEG